MPKEEYKKKDKSKAVEQLESISQPETMTTCSIDFERLFFQELL